MSTLQSNGLSLRGYQRRKAVLDLNVPPCEIREQEGTSQQVGVEEVTVQPVQSVPPATIDVEAIEDDVIESSATAFAEAKNNSRRIRARHVVDIDSGRPARSTNSNCNQKKRRRDPPSQIVINCEHYIDLESSSQSVVRSLHTKDVIYDIFKERIYVLVWSSDLRHCDWNSLVIIVHACVFMQVKEIIKPQPPTKEVTFNCPICMASLTEEMSTRCGHIFCKACIKAAIAAQGKCPTCRKKVTLKELIRVFLPSAS